MQRLFPSVLAAGALALLAQPATAAPDRDAKIIVGWGELLDTLNPATTGNRDVGPIDVNMFDGATIDR